MHINKKNVLKLNPAVTFTHFSQSELRIFFSSLDYFNKIWSLLFFPVFSLRPLETAMELYLWLCHFVVRKFVRNQYFVSATLVPCLL